MSWTAYTPGSANYRRGWVVGLKAPCDFWLEPERLKRTASFIDDPEFEVNLKIRNQKVYLMFRSHDDAIVFKLTA